MTVNERDLRIIERQLGRKPRGVLAVERRCRWGYPQVIKVYPLLRTDSHVEPFPTLFWLTCPILVQQISALEHQGYIDKLEEQIAADEGLRAAYHENHKEYIGERWATLTPKDRALAEQCSFARLLRERGIGGIADWNRIKCLHMHYAHYLARGGNVIGRWLENHLSAGECPPERVLCDRLK